MKYICMQGGHSRGKPRKVGEFDTGQRKVRSGFLWYATAVAIVTK